MGPVVTIPVLGWKVAPLDLAFNGVSIAAGASAAILIPQKAVALAGPKYYWLNQGWYGVGLSALTAAGVASVGRIASPKVAKLLGLGGAFATAIRALAQLAPSQTAQYVTGPIVSAGSAPVMFAPPKPAGANGMGRFLTAGDIIRNETGMKDWVQSGMRDWVDMAQSGSPMDGGKEAF